MNVLHKDLASDEDIKYCLEAIAKYGTPEKAAKSTGISTSLLRRVDIIENKKYNCTKEGIGPENLRQYLIASRDAEAPRGWNNEDPSIIKARQLYNDGAIELLTGRDGMMLNLYAIPRVTKAQARQYF